MGGVVACRIVTSVVDTVMGTRCECYICLTIPDSSKRLHHGCRKRIPVSDVLTLYTGGSNWGAVGLGPSTQRLM
jgi:hypothetical protein